MNNACEFSGGGVLLMQFLSEHEKNVGGVRKKFCR